MKNIKINEDNIKKLTSDKSKFLELSKKIEKKFEGPSLYFYLKVIEKIRTCDYESLFDDNYFFEYLYATLASWGMHRMDKNTRMADFDCFKKSIIDNKESFKFLSKEKIKIADFYKLKEKILNIFDTLKIMKRENAPKLVAHSKTMHFLLPDLIPPIDKGNIVSFFYKTKKNLPQIKDERILFLEILFNFQNIAKKLDLNENDLKNKWDTSIPKLIDNAIIGFNMTRGI